MRNSLVNWKEKAPSCKFLMHFKGKTVLEVVAKRHKSRKCLSRLIKGLLESREVFAAELLLSLNSLLLEINT